MDMTKQESAIRFSFVSFPDTDSAVESSNGTKLLSDLSIECIDTNTRTRHACSNDESINEVSLTHKTFIHAVGGPSTMQASTLTPNQRHQQQRRSPCFSSDCLPLIFRLQQQRQRQPGQQHQSDRQAERVSLSLL
mmetsp:Transcript_31556/g.62416  ORF Transcript_31556/g.62416 Transcript_31556/m.62416 type:complete len:135 (+) Transcript_31556:1099-1503(+)